MTRRPASTISRSCSPPRPQSLLDNIRKKQPWFLGYSDNSAQTEKLATVTRPIQAWYMTATKDLHGETMVDNAKAGGLEFTNGMIPSFRICHIKMSMPHAYAAIVTGSRLGDGLRSIFYDVIIVADPDKLMDYEIGSLADYIAMLALTQLNSLDTCQQLPSIVNMLAPGCDREDQRADRQRYRLSARLVQNEPRRTFGTQQDEMAYQMEKDLQGR